MPVSKSRPIVNLSQIILKTFETYFRDGSEQVWLRQDWKFFWVLNSVISGGNWFYRWECAFSGGTLYPSANYQNDPWKFEKVSKGTHHG